MAAFHSRSNSFPSQSHPVMDVVEDHLCRLKSSESASTSTTSICANLSSKPFHREKAKIGVNELLEESLRLVDLCGFSRDAVRSTKESIQDLESSIRRNRGEKATGDDINAYVALKKEDQQDDHPKVCIDPFVRGEGKIKAKKLVVAFQVRSDQTSTFRDRARKGCGRDLCSLNIHKSSKGMDNITLKQLKSAEMSIQELEEGLEALFRSLVQTRVSLLNVLSH
ncbi:UNVERIFIED_CONTAM: hypothetical protein Sindi_1398700 [Sesamum indicum]